MKAKRLKPLPEKRRKLKSYRVGTRKNSRASARLKELWQDPEFQERMRQAAIKREQMRKEDPARFTRAGVPNGFSKATIKPYWDRAHELADRFIQIMKDQGQLPEDNHTVIAYDEGDLVEFTVAVPGSDDGKAEAALREAFVLAVGPSDQKIKIQAINTVLNFTKSKPEQKSKLTLNRAESFLDALVADNARDGAE